VNLRPKFNQKRKRKKLNRNSTPLEGWRKFGKNFWRGGFLSVNGQ